jgi:hypothetical protein
VNVAELHDVGEEPLLLGRGRRRGLHLGVMAVAALAAVRFLNLMSMTRMRCPRRSILRIMIGILPGHPARSATEAILPWPWACRKPSTRRKASRATGGRACDRGRRRSPLRCRRPGCGRLGGRGRRSRSGSCPRAPAALNSRPVQERNRAKPARHPFPSPVAARATTRVTRPPLSCAVGRRRARERLREPRAAGGPAAPRTTYLPALREPRQHRVQPAEQLDHRLHRAPPKPARGASRRRAPPLPPRLPRTHSGSAPADPPPSCPRPCGQRIRRRRCRFRLRCRRSINERESRSTRK